MAEEAKLFVYGTLRKGHDQPMSQLLDTSAQFLGEGFIQGLLFDLGPFPVAVSTETPEQVVVGDLYLLNQGSKVLDVMDEYEGVGEVLDQGITYQRLKVKVTLKDGEIHDSWVYLHTGHTDHLLPISSGDYLEYLKFKG